MKRPKSYRIHTIIFLDWNKWQSQSLKLHIKRSERSQLFLFQFQPSKTCLYDFFKYHESRCNKQMTDVIQMNTNPGTKRNHQGARAFLDLPLLLQWVGMSYQHTTWISEQPQYTSWLGAPFVPLNWMNREDGIRKMWSRMTKPLNCSAQLYFYPTYFLSKINQWN